MINGMQIYVHLPMFQLGFESFFYSNQILKKEIEIANFAVLPIGDFLGMVLPAPDFDDNKMLDIADNVGYSDQSMIGNLDVLFISFVGILIIPVVMLFAFAILRRRYSSLNTRYENLRNAMFGNMFIRYFMEACLEISICIMLQFHYSDRYGDPILQFDTWFHIVNSVTFIIFGAAIGLFLPFIAIFYVKKFNQWEDETFEVRYGAVFEGLRKDRMSAIGYPILFILRRILFALVTILCIDYLFI